MPADENVTTPTADAGTPTPTFRESVKAEFAAQSQKDQAPDPASDDTPATPPAEETPTGDQSSETVETEDTLLTPEEVAKLSGKELDLYRKAQKNYTLKTQQLAAQRKELEPYNQLIAALKDPEQARQAVEQLATYYGVLPKAEVNAVETEVDDLLHDLPAELDVLRPTLEQFGKNLLNKIQTQQQPIQQKVEEITAKAVADSTTATLTAFGQENPGWEKYESKMLEIAKQIQPTGGMTDMQYLKVLHTIATADVQSAEKTKQVVAKMAKAAEAAEQPTQGVQSERVEYVKPANLSQMSSRERWLASVEAAKRGQKWV